MKLDYVIFENRWIKGFTQSNFDFEPLSLSSHSAPDIPQAHLLPLQRLPRAVKDLEVLSIALINAPAPNLVDIQVGYFQIAQKYRKSLANLLIVNFDHSRVVNLNMVHHVPLSEVLFHLRVVAHQDWVLDDIHIHKNFHLLALSEFVQFCQL